MFCKALRLPAVLTMALTATACTLVIEESDLFMPDQAANSTFSVTNDEGVLFDHNRPREGLWEELGVSFETGMIETSAGAVSIKFARQPDPDKPLIVYCGGNASDIISHGDVVTYKLAPHGDVLMWDYPGYGDSGGEASISAIEAAVRDMTSEIDRFRRSPDQKVVFWGWSLGSFVCSGMAMEAAEAEALVLETPANSAREAMQSLIPWYLSPFIRLQMDDSIAGYDVADLLEGADFPVLILSAKKDEVLPVYLARDLYRELQEAGIDVTYHEFPKARHVDVGVQEGIYEVVSGFLGRALQG